MLNHVERFWAIFGYLLILLAFILDLGILVLLRFGLVGLLFWTWAFQCCWVLVLLVFILDLGISVSLSFGLVGLYFGLGHFSVVEFWSIQVVFQKKCKYQAKRNFWVALLLFLMLFVVPCFPFFFGHVALGLCWLCLKLMLRKIEPCWVVAASFSAHVGPMWSRLGLCWDRVGSCC